MGECPADIWGARPFSLSLVRLQPAIQDDHPASSAPALQATWQLWAALKSKLEGTAWRGLDASMRGTMWDCYVRYYQPFGELLTDMERAGMLVDTAHLAAMEKVSPLHSPPKMSARGPAPVRVSCDPMSCTSCCVVSKDEVDRASQLALRPCPLLLVTRLCNARSAALSMFPTF